MEAGLTPLYTVSTFAFRHCHPSMTLEQKFETQISVGCDFKELWVLV